MSGHVSAKASWDGEKSRLVLDDQMLFHAQLRRLKPGAGEQFVIRIEREEDAYTYGQLKHLYGHVYTPLSEWNGDFVADWHLLLKAAFMPEGKTSLTQLNKEELDAFIRQCEVYAHTAHPEAFALYDQISA